MAPALRELLMRQENVVALWQLPPPQRRATLRAIRYKHWRRLSRQTVLAAPGAASQRQLVWAALLHCGEHARLSGRTALILHGWDQEFDPPHDVVVPHRVQPLPGPSWLRIHRVSQPIVGPAAIPRRTPPHVATAHAGAWARTNREAMFIVISALQQRLISPARMIATLKQLPKLHRRELLAGVTRDFADGSHSLNELDFGTLCRRFSVPDPYRQTRVYGDNEDLRSIDVDFRTASGQRIRVEIEGLHHMNPAQYFADVTRHNSIALTDPATSLRITTWHLRHEPTSFMTALRRAVLEG